MLEKKLFDQIFYYWKICLLMFYKNRTMENQYVPIYLCYPVWNLKGIYTYICKHNVTIYLLSIYIFVANIWNSYFALTSLEYDYIYDWNYVIDFMMHNNICE